MIQGQVNLSSFGFAMSPSLYSIGPIKLLSHQQWVKQKTKLFNCETKMKITLSGQLMSNNYSKRLIEKL